VKTSLTLLDLLRQGGAPEAWGRLIALYTPFIRGWLRRRGLSHADAADLTQDVMVTLVRELPRFEHNGRTGAFRHWLRQVTRNRLLHHLRTQAARPVVAGDGGFDRLLDQLRDGHGEVGRQWEQEHAAYVVGRAWEVVGPGLPRREQQAFVRVIWGQAAVAEVARELGVRPNLVSVWKCRILGRLRREIGDLLDGPGGAP
jgi:RNA polymerase sigma-70 factor (ECF subfamily)